MLTEEAKDFIRVHVGWWECPTCHAPDRHEFLVDGQALDVRQMTNVLRTQFPELSKYSAGTIDQDINKFMIAEGYRSERARAH